MYLQIAIVSQKLFYQLKHSNSSATILNEALPRDLESRTSLMVDAPSVHVVMYVQYKKK